ncbi:MAG TPA: TOBE domain-containing protein, partial [Planctomycetia bacterium]|nr:TOBE domain-containing protein [Planctomycetia bacterium]
LAAFAIPTILVTHDRAEAMSLADRIVVMDRGTIRQQGTVAEVFQTPRDLEVARIVGIETVAAGEVIERKEGLAIITVGAQTLTAVAPEESWRLVHVCIKGEDVILQRSPGADQSLRNLLPAKVTSLAPEGALVRVGLDCGFELSALVTRPACEELRLAKGEIVTAGVKAPSIHLIERRASREDGTGSAPP